MARSCSRYKCWPEGRGKAGGVRVAATPQEAGKLATDLFGISIGGHVVRSIWVELAVSVAKEYYLSVALDRNEKSPLLMFSTSGGVDIEEVAATQPDALEWVNVRPLIGLRSFNARRLLPARLIDEREYKGLASVVSGLYKMFLDCDALLCEINPLAVTTNGEIMALDAKVVVDDYALGRHPDIAAMYDPESATPEERAAHEKDITYVKLDGDIGVLGYGAGLVMSTLDLIVQAGGRPANFCDLGGGGDPGRIVDAFEVVTSTPQVRSVLFNVFGGITRCDRVAAGILTALQTLSLPHPVVVRLDGTNAEEGRKMLADAKPDGLFVEPTMAGAALKVVELAAARPVG